MSDIETRGLLREAQATDDGAAWRRAAPALVRLARWDEAGLALVHARAHGVEVAAVEDALDAPSVLGFSSRGIGAALEYGRLSHAAWTPDGRTLLVVADERTILAFGLEPGSHRRVAELDANVTAVACDRDGTVVASVEGSEGGRLVFLDSGGAVARSVDLAGEGADAIAAWGERGTVFAAVDTIFGVPNTGHVVAVRGDEVAWSHRCEPATLCDDGSFAVWRPPELLLHEPLAAAPRERAPLGGDPLWRLNGDVAPRFPSLRAAKRFARAAAWLTQRRHAYSVVASTSGRHVAVLPAEASVELFDLESGVSRTIRIDGPPLGAAWSPSGRRLAVVTRLRIVLLEFPDDPLVTLEEEWRAVEARGGAGELWRRLERDPRPEVGEWLLRKVEEGSASAETDPRVVAALEALARRRVLVDLARLRAARRGLPRRKAVETALRWTLAVLDGVARGLSCNCALPFESVLAHGDLVRDGAGSFQPDGTEVGPWRCRACGRRHVVASPPPRGEAPPKRARGTRRR